MQPSATSAIAGLPWVRNEIQQTVKTTREAIEAFIEHGESRARLLPSVQALHQVAGALTMLGLRGAALLVEEMEALTLAFGQGDVPHDREAGEALMLALIQIPDYLANLNSLGDDVGQALLPIVNDLRIARGQTAWGEADLFIRELPPFIPPHTRGLARLKATAQRLRPGFQRAFLGWFRNTDPLHSLVAMEQVFQALTEAAESGTLCQVFRAAQGLAATLREGLLITDPKAKAALGKVDKIIRQLMEGTVSSDLAQELFGEQLYLLARSGSSDKIVATLIQDYDLDRLLPDKERREVARARLSAPNQGTIASLAGAIVQELAPIQDALDQVARGTRDVASLSVLAVPLGRLSETVRLIGQPELRERLQRVAQGLTRLEGAENLEDRLLVLASDLVAVENTLNHLAGGTQGEPRLLAPEEPTAQRELARLTLTVAGAELLKIKDAMVAYTNAPQDITPLTQILRALRQVAGALSVLSQVEAAMILEGLAQCLAQGPMANRHPFDSTQLDLVADVVSSIEYFMESLADNQGDLKAILAIGRRAVETLTGHALVLPEAAPVVVTPSPPPSAIPLLGATPRVAEIPIESLALPAAEPEAGFALVLDVGGRQTRASDEFETTGIFELTLEDEPLVETPNQGVPPPSVANIDPEMYEIFMEEAGEELAVIQEYAPQWCENYDDQEAMTRLRRSFHTLKGSGRLVGAKRVGDFSWAFENLLNRVMDGTVEVNAPLMSLMASAVERLSHLIAPDQAALDLDTLDQGLMDQASAFASGEQPAPSLEPSSFPTEWVEVAQSLENVEEEPAGFEVDSALADIYLTEARGHIEILRRFLTLDPHNISLDRLASRALHTLRGSSDMAGVTPVAELAGPLYKLSCQRLFEGLSRDDEFRELLNQGVVMMEDILAMVENPRLTLPDVHPLHEHVTALVAAGGEMPASSFLSELTHVVAMSDTQVLAVALTDSLPNPPAVPPDPPEQLQPQNALLPTPAGTLYPEFSPTPDYELFIEQPEWLQAPDLEEIPETSAEREATYLASDLGLPDTELLPMAADEPLVVKSPQILLPEAAPTPKPWVLAVGETLESINGDPDMLGIFVEEADELTLNLDAGLRTWRENPDDRAPVDNLQRILHTLKGGSRLAGLLAVGDLAHALESLLSAVTQGRLTSTPALQSLAQLATDRLANQIDEVKAGGPLHRYDALMEQLGAMAAGQPPEAARPLPEQAAEVVESAPTPVVTPVESLAVPLGETLVPIEGDPDMLGIFVEEAEELMVTLDAGVRAWRENPEARAPVDNLQRVLHTLKGGSRLAGLSAVGDLAHALESVLSAVTQGRLTSTSTLLGLAQLAADRLANQIDEVKSGGPLHRHDGLMEQLSTVAAGPSRAPVQAAAPLPVAKVPAPPRPKTPAAITPSSSVSAMPPRPPPAAQPPATRPTAATQAQQNQVRVRADLLDALVNDSGEINIYRARLQQKSSEVGFQLDELEQTVSRLRDQLRRMTIETEAQMLSRYDRQPTKNNRTDEFDPLELDRFTGIQELSRTLMETLDDMENIKESLEAERREVDTLLLQQQRVANSLQDGLLRTRMVPFSQVVPRLTRVVRQAAATLSRQAELHVQGDEGELDRSILERMVSPLEHLLRNSVSHGIESPERRAEVGKPPTGEVRIRLWREGNDVLLEVSDDGAGLDLVAIRQRAIERGLMTADAVVSDDDIKQFVLEPGFSTARQINQIAGRGVGMDVVINDIRQFGGSLDIDSETGRGSRFTIRLPLTLAMLDAILVRVGEDVFAVPTTTIEGVARIDRSWLAANLSNQVPFSYAGNQYEVNYLGSLLLGVPPSLNEGRKRLPALLVRSRDYRAAFFVDQVLGTRQIVVKTVGPQLSHVRWISGGTILAEGQVAMILDIAALLRGVRRLTTLGSETATLATLVTATPALASTPAFAPVRKQSTVMVVDDSITVRKFTARMLDRHGFLVVTAKDGVDALTQLQEHTPDVMLLDLEMPRMDGFELATHLRNSEAYRSLPIIVITSRTGEKHRERALEIGVNRYMGKPFEENDLIATLQTLVAEARL
ncbi:MAG: Hpt domain-containing protein [Pseudomonadota bacterium]